LIKPIGLALQRVPKGNWKCGNSIIIAKVGNFLIEVPNLNPISNHYSLHPNYSSQIGRLVSLLKKKYPDLAALDIGANVGDTVCIIKSAEDIYTLSIEGDESTFRFLEKNLAQFSNASAHKMFLGEKTGAIAASFDKSGWNTTIKPEHAGKGTAINIVSLDDFLQNIPDTGNFKLLKVDTEGFDCSILRGAKQFIANTSPVIAFEYNRGNMDLINETGIDTLWMLEDFGYSEIIFHDFAGKLICATHLSEHSLIKDLHDYADGVRSPICYYDITVFHSNDRDLAVAFAEKERVVHRDPTFQY
jgi:FkbM family methyltransferase